MPGPTTEVLNEDVKAIRAETKGLGEKVDGVDKRVVRVEAQLDIFKWLVGLTLLATLGNLGGGIWWAATITNEVRSLESRVDKMDARFDRLESQLADIRAAVGGVARPPAR